MVRNWGTLSLEPFRLFKETFIKTTDVITLILLHPIKETPIQSWSFAQETTIRLGRSTDNHVILYSAVVSRHHAELQLVGDQWYLVNQGTNGTYLDGQRITKVPVTDGLTFRLARSGPNLRVHLGVAALQEVLAHSEEQTLGQVAPQSTPTQSQPI